jgi:hypothetical protein
MMIYLNAFVLGGVICMLFQLMIMITKIDPARILIFGFALGAVLTAVGVAPAMVKFGGMGLDCQVLGAGSAVEATAEAMLNGVPVPLFLVIGLLACLAIIGLIGGVIRSSMGKK